MSLVRGVGRATNGTGSVRSLPPAARSRFRSLASRLVAIGLVQLVLLAVTAGAIFIAEGPHEPGRPEDQLDRTTIEKLETLAATSNGQVANPVPLATQLDALLRKRIEVSLYDENHQLLASNVEPALALTMHHMPPMGHDHDRGDHPPPPPPPGDMAPPGGPPPEHRSPGPDHRDWRPDFGPREGGPHVMVIPFHPNNQRGYLVARGVPGDPPGLTGPALVLIGGFIILVLGALVTARWIVRPVERLSRTARALGAGDLQARSRLERFDEIGVLGHRIDEMADRIEGLLVTEKELLANVAHELRTPLTRIGVALDLANEGDAEAARASIAEIAVDVSELETIVDDILTAMRFEIATTRAAAQLPLRRAVIPAEEIADAAAERLRVRHAQRPLVLHATAPLPAIDVDPVLFRRVIDNLLANAHKYTPDTRSAIELDAHAEGNEVVFEVRDHGSGIPAEDLPRIFTAFFRGERSRSRETGGVGLGLTLAKRIVEAHGGTIEVSSELGVGTTVRVAVPSVA
ncbi:MAG TPA: HAMP domain-containing sensor histidine kinase [Kofleriaceae bacterium]|jgi:signal transduction histidine kinase